MTLVLNNHKGCYAIKQRNQAKPFLFLFNEGILSAFTIIFILTLAKQTIT